MRAFLFGMMLVAAVSAQEPYKVRKVSDVATVKSAHPATRMDLYLPEGAEDFPVFMFIHGGAWRTGDKSMYENLGRTFAFAGIGAAVINYPQGPRHPAHVRQAACALAWIHANAATYRWDLDNLFVGGHSCGGHMAALLTLDPKYLKEAGLKPSIVRGCIVLDAVALDLDHAKERPPLLLDMYQGAFGPEENWHAASPMTWVTRKSAPFLLLLGENDDAISHEDTRQFAAKLKEQDTAVESAVIPGRDHFGMVTAIRSPADPVAAKIIEFIRSPP
jgi:acetyl esterase/lipase